MSYFKSFGYFHLLKESFIHPQQYKILVKNNLSTKDALIFFIINIIFGNLFKAVGDIFYYQNPVGIFLSITEISLILPVAALGLIMLAAILHLIAKILGGQGDFKTSLRAVSYSSSPLIFFWIPFISPFVLIYIIFLMISNFYQSHSYTITYATFNILIPFLVILTAYFLLNSY